MKLYYAPGTCAVGVWIAMAWADADVSAVRVDYSDPAYKKINPLGLVPAVDIGGARPMTELAAILDYLSERYADKDLGADDSIEDRFLYNETKSFLSSDFHPAFGAVFGPSRFTMATDDEAVEKVKKAGYIKVDGVMTHLNDHIIGDNEHIYKNKKTFLDAVAYVMVRWSRFTPKSWEQYPNIQRFMAMMDADESVQKIIQESEKE
ncbi:glutathione S-transferase family protein [Peptoniphilus equinus]|uniref:Glutathione S-transferase family protein n=1 Tax=Peptoniphilus equinus TaxID=3016343 RepID=A0ABY7QT71_9FIRM|nr:glutathione S-transferase family protein [Peptoniphilus equinus]WBW49485.1 glutathione S-transferase family protein [Peptoniphilus equinus]